MKCCSMADKPMCPRCGSQAIIHYQKGYSVAKVIVLTVCTFGIFGLWALLAGFIGRKKIIMKCTSCGKKWTV